MTMMSEKRKPVLQRVISVVGLALVVVLCACSDRSVTGTPGTASGTAAPGTLNNPYRTDGQVRDGRFRVNSLRRNMSAEVERMNVINRDPEAGEEWVLANVTFACNVPNDQTCNVSQMNIEMTGRNGEIYTVDWIVDIEGRFNGEVYGGREVTGNIGFVVNQSDSDLKIVVNDWGGRTYFVSPF